MQKLSLDVDVLTVLLKARDMCLRRRDILELLYPKYEKTYEEDVFSVTLWRILNRLMKQDKIMKDDRGHKQVFYFIEERQREGAQEFVDQEQAVNGFKHYWSVLQPKEKEETLKALLALRIELDKGGPPDENVIERSKWILNLRKRFREVKNGIVGEKKD
jgi:hypothetical protein